MSKMRIVGLVIFGICGATMNAKSIQEPESIADRILSFVWAICGVVALVCIAGG